MTIGMFVWRELSTRDPEGATRFYGEVFGWKVTSVPMGENYTYYLVHNGEKQVAGFAPKMGDDPSPDGWIGYVHVADVDAAAAAAKAHGATVLVPYMEIPNNMGALGVFMDPQGATIGVYQSGSPPPPAKKAPAKAAAKKAPAKPAAKKAPAKPAAKKAPAKKTGKKR